VFDPAGAGIGSVKNPNTVSGVASIHFSWTIGSVPTASVMAASTLFAFGLLSQHLESLVPELPEELTQAAESLRPGAVQTAGAVAPLEQQSRLAQHPQVLRDGGPGDVAEVRGYRSGRQLGVANESQDLAAVGLGDGLDGFLQQGYVSRDLRKI
jgi:hypothetical protein